MKFWRTKTPPPHIEMLFGNTPFARLEKDGDEFVFTYLPVFKELRLAPLPGLPSDRAEHRSRDLFLFFQERIPELSRPEIRAWLDQAKIDESDQIRLLGLLSRRAVTDSFELRLEEAG